MERLRRLPLRDKGLTPSAQRRYTVITRPIPGRRDLLFPAKLSESDCQKQIPRCARDDGFSFAELKRGSPPANLRRFGWPCLRLQTGAFVADHDAITPTRFGLVERVVG